MASSSIASTTMTATKAFSFSRKREINMRSFLI
jgi:hypothetical protein